MANGEEVNDSSIKPTDSRAASESGGSKSRQMNNDDPDRVGGDIQTRSGDKSGANAKTGEGGEQPTGGSTPARDDDPVRGA